MCSYSTKGRATLVIEKQGQREMWQRRRRAEEVVARAEVAG